MLISTVSKRTAQKSRSDVFEIVLIYGGAKEAVVKFHGRRSYEKTLTFDYPIDPENCKALCQKLKVDTVSPGKGHTTSTLCEHELPLSR